MKILSIETSCDETAVSLVEASGDFTSATYQIRGNALFSQVDIHREYGGVFPALAKREHAATLVPMTIKALKDADNLEESAQKVSTETKAKIKKLLEREPGLAEKVLDFTEQHSNPEIDLIAVTAGPGLEPALWVGVNFAKALGILWNTPVVGVNHMEGHVLASVFSGEKLADVQFPALSLLISGGHTELIKISDWQHYEKIGQTRDDAVGEAFDKVARLLGLPYPGGPEISRLAQEFRNNYLNNDLNHYLNNYIKLPRPMLESGDLDFSFSGLKTAVRYAVEGKDLSEKEKQAIACEFENAAAEVLLKKTEQAVNEHDIKSLILGGGVSANQYLRQTFTDFFQTEYPEVTLYLPDPKLSTDNSVMIALAGHARAKSALLPATAISEIVASGNRSLAEE